MVSPNVPAEFGGNLSPGHLGYLRGSSLQVLLCHWESFAHAEFCPHLDAQDSQYQHSWQDVKPWDQAVLSSPSPSLPPPGGLLNHRTKCRPRQAQWPRPHSTGPKVWARPRSSNPSTWRYLARKEIKVRNKGKGGRSSSERQVRRHQRTQKDQAEDPLPCSLGPGQSWLTLIWAEGTEGRGRGRGQNCGRSPAHSLLQFPPSPCSEEYQTTPTFIGCKGCRMGRVPSEITWKPHRGMPESTTSCCVSSLLRPAHP